MQTFDIRDPYVVSIIMLVLYVRQDIELSCFQFKSSSPLKANHKNEERIKHNNDDTSFGRGCSQPVVLAVS